MPFMPLIYEESGFFLRQAGHSFLIVWAQLNAAPLSSTTSRIGDDTLHQAGSPARGPQPRVRAETRRKADYSPVLASLSG